MHWQTAGREEKRKLYKIQMSVFHRRRRCKVLPPAAFFSVQENHKDVLNLCRNAMSNQASGSVYLLVALEWWRKQDYQWKKNVTFVRALWGLLGCNCSVWVFDKEWRVGIDLQMFEGQFHCKGYFSVNALIRSKRYLAPFKQLFVYFRCRPAVLMSQWPHLSCVMSVETVGRWVSLWACNDVSRLISSSSSSECLYL